MVEPSLFDYVLSCKKSCNSSYARKDTSHNNYNKSAYTKVSGNENVDAVLDSNHETM